MGENNLFKLIHEKEKQPNGLCKQAVRIFHKFKSSSLVRSCLCRAVREPSSMAYGFRELSKQKKVWVLGQSQAMNSYPLSDIMSLVTVGDKGSADLFPKHCHSKHLRHSVMGYFLQWSGQRTNALLKCIRSGQRCQNKPVGNQSGSGEALSGKLTIEAL